MHRKEIYRQYPHLDKASECDIPGSVVWHEKVVLRYLPPHKEARILELGCGNGAFLWLLKEKGYSCVTGVDSSPAQVEIGKKLGLKIVQRDVLTYLRNIDEESFEVIAAFDLLEHLYKDEIIELLKLSLRGLKTGGILIFKVPNGESIFSGAFRYGDFVHEVSFTHRSIRQVFITVGFREVETFPVGPVVHGVKSLVRAILWGFIDKVLRAYLLIETGSCKDYILTQNLWGIARK